jgi:guanylate kinase
MGFALSPRHGKVRRMNPAPRLGVLLVVSGPSGSGKTTLCRALGEREGCLYSVSCTTRAPRTGERDGIDYRFLSEETFVELLEQGAFLEHALVHGRRYGTLRKDVIDALGAGRDVVMDLDVQGADQVRNCEDPLIRRAHADVFVTTGTEEELERRLTGRGTETEEQLGIRLSNAREEVACWPRYRYLVLSGSREQDEENIRHILRAERLRANLVSRGPAFTPPA